MKLVYCISDYHAAGGTERTLSVQANYFANNGHEVHIISTDKSDLEKPFYSFSDKIKFHSLNINYCEVDGKLSVPAILQRMKLGKIHKQTLSNLLYEIKPDFTFSLFGHEFSFLYKIKDGSRKISQFHFSKNYKIIESHYSSMGILEKAFMLLKDWRKKLFVKYYDAFVVLTNEDAKEWGNRPNLYVVPNAVSFYPDVVSKCDNKIVISVGRLVYQKGYDMLVDIWNIVNKVHPDWKLMVFGTGIERKKLDQKIINLGLKHSFLLMNPVKDIIGEYQKASLFVSSSRYEGFPMTLLESMSCGIPCISFACPCGPSEIITCGEDGFVIPNGNIEEMANKICYLIENSEKRVEMGIKARNNINRYSVENVMRKWEFLLSSFMNKNK